MRRGLADVSGSHPDQMQGTDGTPDLLLTALSAPQLSGRELAHQLRALHPRARLLFMAGYSGEEPPEESEDQNVILQKPFKPQVLARRIREILEA